MTFVAPLNNIAPLNSKTLEHVREEPIDSLIRYLNQTIIQYIMTQ